jgi:hypothetical protein
MSDKHHINNAVEEKINHSNFKLAINATVHCLVGCFLGELTGLLISIPLKLDTLDSTLLAVILGFAAGLLLGVRPLLKAGYKFYAAIKTIMLAEGISIAVMEGFEIIIMFLIPGVMSANIFDLLFWGGMISGLAVGFVAAFPINYVMIKRGVRHAH